MYRGSDELPSGGVNRYLFLEAQDGVHDYAVQACVDLPVRIRRGRHTQRHRDGRGVQRAHLSGVNYGYQISFNPAERSLYIDLSPDKERYAPGDEATLDITVTDENGDAQPQTEVNLSVVDEALFLTSGGSTYTRDLLVSVMFLSAPPSCAPTPRTRYRTTTRPRDLAPQPAAPASYSPMSPSPAA